MTPQFAKRSTPAWGVRGGRTRERCVCMSVKGMYVLRQRFPHESDLVSDEEDFVEDIKALEGRER